MSLISKIKEQVEKRSQEILSETDTEGPITLDPEEVYNAVTKAGYDVIGKMTVNELLEAVDELEDDDRSEEIDDEALDLIVYHVGSATEIIEDITGVNVDEEDFDDEDW